VILYRQYWPEIASEHLDFKIFWGGGRPPTHPESACLLRHPWVRVWTHTHPPPPRHQSPRSAPDNNSFGIFYILTLRSQNISASCQTSTHAPRITTQYHFAPKFASKFPTNQSRPKFRNGYICILARNKKFAGGRGLTLLCTLIASLLDTVWRAGWGGVASVPDSVAHSAPIFHSPVFKFTKIYLGALYEFHLKVDSINYRHSSCVLIKPKYVVVSFIFIVPGEVG
jgi:hypothetical protein